jgi:lipid-A-disaccharide synthase
VKQKCFALVAGEPSGDALGEGLMKCLKARYPKARFVGIGGPKMQAQGLELLYPMHELSVMGIFEVLKRLHKIMSIMRNMKHILLKLNPDCFIGIDAPDFNLRLSKALKNSGIKTVHYVSPSIWAWRPNRIFTIAKATDHVLSILPFEKPLYEKYHVPCTFVGHSLADQIPMVPDYKKARGLLGLVEGNKYLAVLPGSRQSEVSRLGPLFFQAMVQISQVKPELHYLVPCISHALEEQLQAYKKEYAEHLSIKFYQSASREVLAAADQVLLASGTAALEAMLMKKPMVVAYKMNPLTFSIASRMLNIEHASLPNLLTQREPKVPELIQEQCTSDNIAQKVVMQFHECHEELRQDFSDIHSSLKQNASQKAAETVSSLIE